MEGLKKYLLSDKKQLLKIIVEIIAVIVIFYFLKGELKNLNIIEIIKTLRGESNERVMMILVLSLGAVAVTTLYDIVLCKDLGIKNIPKRRLFKISWIANTTNNFVGFGGVTGGSLRTAFYKNEGIDILSAVSISVIIWMTTLTGLSGLMLLNFKFIFLLDNTIYLISACLLVLYIPFYMLIGKFVNCIPIIGEKLKSNVAITLPIRIKIHMVVIAILEWASAGIFFSFIVGHFAEGVTLSQSLAVFSIATAIGICTLIPGGLGSFELACIYGFGLLSVDNTSIISAVLIYRIFYFAIPWVLSLFVLIEEFIVKKFKKTIDFDETSLINDLGIKALATIVFISGFILTLSAAIPLVAERFKLVRRFLSMPMLQFSQVAIMGIGIILIILSKGILSKVKQSYYITLVLLILGAALSLIKGVNILGAIWLIVTAILIYLSKDRFYRESSTIKIKNAIILFISILFISGIYDLIYTSIVNHKAMGNHRAQLTSFMFSGYKIFYYLIIISLSAFVFRLFMVKKPSVGKATEKDLIKLEEFLCKHKGNSKTHLLYLKDKSFFYYKEDKVLIAYKMFKDKAIVLGDPIGEKQLIGEAINDFRKYFDTYDIATIFYEVSEEYLHLYHENGYRLLKLGEEASIDLNNFNLNGKSKNDLRTIRNKVEKGYMKFEIINPPLRNEVMKRLLQISNEWLGDRHEKGFSMGWFNEEYINKSPIAVIKYEDDIIGFASLSPMYNDEGLAIDLMRIIKNPPNGAMDALFLGIINWAKENRYKEFSLGMAPLSNVGVNEFSNISEKIVKEVYKYGERIYKFKGLRKYKEKFGPEWKSRYLAYPSKYELPGIIVDLFRMISASPKEEK
ncbi:bifunctional lysylphosphatidylglycerol flippase/synthetase MprF [Clostridium carnis]